MKKLFLVLLLGLGFIVSGSAGSPDSSAGGPGCDSERGIKITITVTIGRPPTCSLAWAVCSVTIGGGLIVDGGDKGLTAFLESPTESGSSGGGSGGGGGKSWKIHIPRENLAELYPEFLTRLDGKNRVAFESTFVMPTEVQDALNTKESLVIQGNRDYPLQYENGVYIITVSL